MAVYNANSSDGDFSVTAEGTTIAGSANGGLLPDTAPGACMFSTADGAAVRLMAFNASWSESNPDTIGTFWPIKRMLQGEAAFRPRHLSRHHYQLSQKIDKAGFLDLIGLGQGKKRGFFQCLHLT